MTKLCGYATINGDTSQNIAPKNSKSAVHERIRANSLTIDPDCFANCHHTDSLSAFAFAKDGSLTAKWDATGLKFSAELPPDTTAGIDVANALRAGLRLGVSVEFSDAQYVTDNDGVREITSGVLKAISLTRPGAAYYRAPGVWMENATDLPADVQALRVRFNTTAPKPAPKSIEPKPAPRIEPKHSAKGAVDIWRYAGKIMGMVMPKEIKAMVARQGGK